MKYFLKVLIIFTVLFCVEVLFLEKAQADTVNYSDNTYCTGYFGARGTCPFHLGNAYYQAFEMSFSAHLDGNGAFGHAGGAGAVSGCLSASGVMWDGSCWNWVDSHGAGHVGDGDADFSGSGSIGNDYRPGLKYAVWEFYVNDANWTQIHLAMTGRRVDLIYFNPSTTNLDVGQNFTASWDFNWSYGQQLTLNGPISCNQSGEVNDWGTVTCTATGGGTASLKIEGKGPSGYGVQYPSSTIYITQSTPPETPPVTPPAPTGRYKCLGTNQCGWDPNDSGPNQCSKNADCAPPPKCSGDCATFISQSVPDCMVPGSSHAVSVTMNNNGTTIWKPASGYKLGSQNPQDNRTWGTGRAYLSSSVSPKNSTTINFNVTAPSSAGTYNFRWRMLREGVRWFGDYTRNLSITVNNSCGPPLNPTGTLTPEAPSCVIASGQSSCNINFSWTTENPVGTSVVTKPVNVIVATGNSGNNVPFVVKYNAETFYLYNNAILLDQETVTSSCASGSAWDGSICASFNYNLSNSGNSNVTKTSGNAYTQNTITKTLISGTTQPVTLSLSGVPSGTSYSISNSSCSLTCASVITFTVTPSTRAGTYPITVTGSPLSKQTTFNLVVYGNPIIVTCSASPGTALLGETVTWTANVSGGTPPLLYLWSGTNIPTSPAPNTNPFSISYGTIGQKMATVTVTDIDSVRATCPASVVQINFNPLLEEF